MFCLLGLWIYTLCLALSVSLYFPSTRLLFFAPFLVVSFYRGSLRASLWWALLCGWVVDLFSSHPLLGTSALNYCLTVRILYRSRFRFFEDRLSTLPLMTFFFTLLSTLIQAGIVQLFGYPFELSWEWIKGGLLFTPLQNVLYASLAFRIPLSGGRRGRIGLLSSDALDK